MPTERVLIEVVTAANMAGIEQAQKGMLGLSATTIALAALLGGLVKVGRDGIENYKAQQTALAGLKQAYETQHRQLSDNLGALNAFIAKNAEYIKNQYDVIDALSLVVRAGNDQADSFRLLNDALDLSVIKHEDVSVAADSLIKVLAGNSRALRELGITTEQYNAIMKDKTLTTEQKHIQLLELIEAKTKGGRTATDENTKSQNELTIAWQNFTTKIGPGATTVWSGLNTAAARGLGIMSTYVDLVGKMYNFYAGILGLNKTPPAQQYQASFASNVHARGTRASGGPVSAGGAYTVGEHGPETLVMGGQGGSIIPNGAGGDGGPIVIHNHLHLDGHQLDLLTNTIIRRGRFAPGR